MQTESTFADLGVPAPLVRTLTESGITLPFPIQISTLPDTMAGRDVLGRGKTGSGKTLAFSIPLVTRLADKTRRPSRPAGLVLAPTRELATQITATLEPLAAVYGLRVTTIFGGVPQSKQVRALKAGVDIVVACPGRLEDLMQQRVITLDGVEITVIDEADHMADLGFLPGVTRILAATPAGGQRMMFSATLDNGVDKLVKRFLRNEIAHSVDSDTSPVDAMTHHVFHVSGVEAKKQLVHTLASGTGRRILFMRTKHHARKLAKQSIRPASPQLTCTATFLSPRATVTWPRSPLGRRACWWPPTSPRAVCTSTTSSWWCTSTRRPSTRRTCTAPDAPRVRAGPVTSSPWCCPSSAATPRHCCARRVSPPHRNRFRPIPIRCRRWSARWLPTRRPSPHRLPHRRRAPGRARPATVGRGRTAPAPRLGPNRFRTGDPAGRTLDVASRHPSQ